MTAPCRNCGRHIVIEYGCTSCAWKAGAAIACTLVLTFLFAVAL